MGEEIFLSKTSISNTSSMFLHVCHITQGSFSDYSASVGVCGADKPQNEEVKLDILAVRTSTAERYLTVKMPPGVRYFKMVKPKQNRISLKPSV